jgi:plastocyanin
MDRGVGGNDNGGLVTPEGQVDTHLTDTDANNYDGTGSIVDETGTGSLTIEVGPGGNFQFNPAAVRINPGTTVTWEWLSDGHSVEQVNRGFVVDKSPTATKEELNEMEQNLIDFDFEDAPIQNEGATHEYTFESAGVFLYQCGAHAEQDDGAIIIER